MTLNFLLALAANTCFYFGFQALFPTLPLYVERLGGTPADNGLVTLAFAATAVLSRPYLGGLTDRWGRKPVMLIGAAIFAVTPLGYAISHSVAGILLTRAFQGVGIAAFTTAYQALIVDLSPPERRGQSLGLSANSMAVALVLGPLAGDAAMTHLGFTALFLASAASAALCALLVILVQPPALHHAEARLLANLHDVLAQRGLRTGLIGMSLIGLIFGTFITFIPLYAQNAELGAPGPFFTAYALALIAVQVSAGRLSDRVGRVKVAAPGLVLIGVFMLALSQARVAWVGWGAAFLYGLAAGSARVAIDGMVADSVPPHQRAMAMGLQFTSHDLWIGLGGALMGPLAQAAGYSTMYAVAGTLIIAGAIPFTLYVSRSAFHIT